MANLLTKMFAGEMDPLKTVKGFFKGGKWSEAYSLNTDKVDYDLVRELYWNTNDKYNLGGAFIKPTIDAVAGFVGVPKWVSTDKMAQKQLDLFHEELMSSLSKINVKTFRDADAYVRVYREGVEELGAIYKNEEPRFKAQLLPPGSVTPKRSPETGRIIGYKVTTVIENENGRTYQLNEVITKDTVETFYDGKDIPADVRQYTERNPLIEVNKWGLVPIVAFHNEQEEDELFGRSDITPILPYIKAYHDVLNHALKNNKLHSAPKLVVNVEDMITFFSTNFGVDLNNMKPGEKPKLDLSGQDIIFTPAGSNDSIDLKQAADTSAGSIAVLQLLFYCIVQVSETPEFIYGTEMGQARASTKDQMTSFIKKVERKREMLESGYKMLARILLSMHESAHLDLGNTGFKTYDTKLEWNEVSNNDAVADAQALSTVGTFLLNALAQKTISLETFITEMRKYLPNIDSFAGEMKRIETGAEFLDRMSSSSTQLFDEANTNDNTDPKDNKNTEE